MQPAFYTSIGRTFLNTATCAMSALTIYRASMSLRAAFPAKTLATQEDAPVLPESAADYGLSSPDSFANYNRATFSWKTLQLCLDGEWEPYSETWPRSGMTRNGSAYQRPPLVRRIYAIESSLWPTPDASAANIGEPLDTWMAHRERVKAQKKNGNGFGTPLAIAVKLWSTPTATRRGAPADPTKKRPGGGGRTLARDLAAAGDRGELNPPWVEWLMGFPPGWTDLED
jgi:hypothetical protein